MTQETNPTDNVPTHELMAIRRNKLNEWRTTGKAYPVGFKRDAISSDILTKFSDHAAEALEAQPHFATLAGRMMTRRQMGKASFAHILDKGGRIQLYIKQDEVGDEQYEAFKQWDLGDIIGVHGQVFKTRTGELSIKVNKLCLLTKALRPLPDKFHGLTDQETRYRQRYLDLIANQESRETFLIRSKVIDIIRDFLKARQFLEVETPMMQILAGGAAAKPFITHHHALNIPLFLRIAPELYLKRLIVGGFESVFEINRNFRNEGISTKHNPEFTMLEFYQAYADYEELMSLTESLFREITSTLFKSNLINYQGITLDFGRPFARLTLKEAILFYNSDLAEADISSLSAIKKAAEKLGITLAENAGLGKYQVEIFEKTVEDKLIQPTFITGYPAESSPLARRNDQDDFLTDRFELFIAGKEIANGFNELNDPDDQAARFKEQMLGKAAGDEEAMPYDEDYIAALEQGMPPTAGEGIGIDRLVMLLTDSPSIRDVILFPHMRPKEGAI